MELTDKQWERIQGLIAEPVVRADGKGRPWRDKRQVLEGILWILRTGAPWKDLPRRFPPYQTCHRRFQHWQADGTLRKVVEALALDLQQRGGLDMSECFIDGTFCLAKKGGALWAKLKEAKAPRSWQSQTLLVLFYLSPSSQLLLMK